LSARDLDELPNGRMLAEGATIFDRLSGELQAVANSLASILAAADTDLSALRARWDERRQAADETYERLLRELQKSKIDGAEFIRLRQQIEELRPLREKKDALSTPL
jgi:hypothetical protein